MIAEEPRGEMIERRGNRTVGTFYRVWKVSGLIAFLHPTCRSLIPSPPWSVWRGANVLVLLWRHNGLVNKTQTFWRRRALPQPHPDRTCKSRTTICPRRGFIPLFNYFSRMSGKAELKKIKKKCMTSSRLNGVKSPGLVCNSEGVEMDSKSTRSSES